MSNFNNYLDKIFESSNKYLLEIFSEREYNLLVKNLKKNKDLNSNEDCISIFNREYTNLIKIKHQKTHKIQDKSLNEFIGNKDSNLKIVWGDCLNALKCMDSESIQLMITSPPYYNARDYSQWKDIDDYLSDMRDIIEETYRVLDNHRVWVFNVGDIFDNPNTKTRSVWGKQRLALGSKFIELFEEAGFTFVDDILWDKGEVQSQRQKNAGKPYPMYQYPMNVYEHILIFHKHRLDLTHFPCPVCGSLKVSGNTQTEPGLQSWECKNDDCFERSKSNRGKRFSLKTNITQSKENQKNEDNIIEKSLVQKWRRDIVKFSPVIKINSKGQNILGHTAPFPEDIPEMAVKFFSYAGENVLDPFAGSFTTAKVAAELGRIGIGIELDVDLKKAVRDRLNNVNTLFSHKILIDELDISKKKKINRQL